ncbi:MAG: methyltransferase domain-containing protein [Nanoarchaeota archaeon]|nr:methyltransferase domain-containing protein [Nanoarchaeota archaeon]
MEKNTPELWDNLWKRTAKGEDTKNLQREELSIRWQRIEKIIKAKFGSFSNLEVIEVGAGSGTNSILFAKRGAKVTILDYSKQALKRSKEFFKRNNCEAEFILADALKLPKKLKGKYDVAMSFGLAEHFQDTERIKVIKSHMDLMGSRGIVLISVPNKINPPYRIHKFIMESLGFWKFGEEYPFSRQEFKKISNILRIKKIHFLGDSLISSFRFINPILLLKKKLGIKRKVKKERGTFLDRYLSYSLVFIGEKF